MKNFFKSKLTRPKRLLIIFSTITLSILTISLGSALFVSKKSNLSTEYGGGAEYVVKINPETTGDKVKESKRISSSVAQEIYNRIDSLGVVGAQVHPEISSDGARVRVTYPGITSEEKRKEIEKLITEKPKLTFTDIYGNYLFDEYQNFNKELVGSTGKLSYLSEKSNTPIKPGSAVEQVNKTQMSILENKTAEWTNATKYISSLKKGANKIVVWLDLDKFIKIMKRDWPEIWKSSGENPYVAAQASVKGKKKGETFFSKRKYTIDASKYLISSPTVSEPLRGSKFVIEGLDGINESKDLARQINYGSSNYKLELEYSNYVKASYGANAFQKAILAGIIVFIFIAIFLIANYGVLGLLSTISISLFVFVTLTLFTIMNGQYSPESIAALIIGIGMAVDANIITFERLKSELYRGSNLQKGFKDANKKSISTIVDSNITTLIVALVLFFFGTRNIIGLSVTLILSIILTLVVMLGFTRFTSSMIIKTKIFDDKMHWLGYRPKIYSKIENRINKYDYIKAGKYFNYVSFYIFFVAFIVLVTTAALANSFSGGFNLSQDFTGGTNILIVPNNGSDFIEESKAVSIKEDLIKRGLSGTDIEFIKESNKIVSIKFNSTKTFASSGNWKNLFESNFSNINFIQSVTTNDVAKKILFNALTAIAIAIIGIVIYTLFRFKWTFSISAIIALLHDALIVIAFFVIIRIEISPVFIAGLLSIIGYSINDTIVTFDRLREKTTEYEGEMTDKKIKELANSAIKETIKRSLFTSFTTILAILILMSFGNATKLSFNIAMLIGLFAGTYSSIFIATFVWTKLEMFRQKRIIKRKNNDFWFTEGTEEQTFEGINDFNV